MAYPLKIPVFASSQKPPQWAPLRPPFQTKAVSASMKMQAELDLVTLTMRSKSGEAVLLLCFSSWDVDSCSLEGDGNCNSSQCILLPGDRMLLPSPNVFCMMWSQLSANSVVISNPDFNVTDSALWNVDSLLRLLWLPPSTRQVLNKLYVRAAMFLT